MEKPIPKPNADTEYFWEGCKQNEFRFQRCKTTGKAQFYPRRLSIHSPDNDLEWEVSKGLGTVYTVTTAYRGPSLAFKEDCPYQIALVDMDEGFRFMANVVEGVAEIGTRVRVTFEKRGDQMIPQVIVED